MAEPPFDVSRAHRWFAVEFNNAAWDLVEKPSRTAEEDEQMVHLAHASCLHWKHDGTPLNHQRAQILLTNVYCQLNFASAAMRHAEKALELCESNGDSQTPFDRATSYLCAAQANACAGNEAKARELKQNAIEAAGEIEHPDEKRVFEQMLHRADGQSVE